MLHKSVFVLFKARYPVFCSCWCLLFSYSFCYYQIAQITQTYLAICGCSIYQEVNGCLLDLHPVSVHMPRANARVPKIT